jgi:hypothetical protein
MQHYFVYRSKATNYAFQIPKKSRTQGAAFFKK